ncbi:tRNA (adenosine(37)-N6)-threonylcarbamoyltransferase complex ATPase subunit type 1 TsaE [Tumebacillus sp. BK434]|uniref:tRNA (adenosine(37)-N6)-threonylcarbamoyltransferase complex ATPase subunit type 1 TsaE n=1 Tax=Tumebacillus sp. BK434 TaxID=2512169 RepID=UPI001FB2DE17|nr:tRNA (adenosine(37)-N6)-threonylcarbamoyltransferase complex ATPase subunit type 1 TsaE [Tumebacillus sp. BK434]
MLTYHTRSVDETQAVAKALGAIVQPGDLLCLTGDLGAGKTTFTQGLARGLGVEEPVSSPTFTIIKEYDEGRIPLYHMDIYRLGESAAEEDLGFDEYFFGEGVSVVEWAEWLQEVLPEDRLQVTVHNLTPTDREISFAATGPRAEARLKELEKTCPTSR